MGNYSQDIVIKRFMMYGIPIVMQCITWRDSAGDVNFEFCIWCIVAFLRFKLTPQLSKLIKVCQFYKLKKDQKSLLFSLLISE